MQGQKNQALIVLPFPCCNYSWISGPPEQYNLSPLLPHRERVFALLSPPPPPSPSIHASSNQQMTCKRPLFHSLYLGYKSGLRTPVQRWFFLERARFSNRVSHSNKLYFPPILSHVWTFFSNPHTTTRPRGQTYVSCTGRQILYN